MAGTAPLRQRAIELLQQNISQAEIAARLGVSRVTINQWAKILRESGADALLQRAHKGRLPRLTDDQRGEIASWLSTSAQDQGLQARRWTGREVATLIRRRFGVAHTPSYCLALCRAMGVPLESAYRPPRKPRRSSGRPRGRPAKISGPAADKLRSELLAEDRGRSPRGWTRQELVAFVEQRTGIAYAADSISALLDRLGVSLQIIPERQRRIETRRRLPKPQRGRRLTAEQITQLHSALREQADIASWSPERVKSFIWDRFHVRYAPSYIPHLLQQVGILIRRPRPRRPRILGRSGRERTRPRRRQMSELSSATPPETLRRLPVPGSAASPGSPPRSRSNRRARRR